MMVNNKDLRSLNKEGERSEYKGDGESMDTLQELLNGNIVVLSPQYIELTKQNYYFQTVESSGNDVFVKLRTESMVSDINFLSEVSKSFRSESPNAKDLKNLMYEVINTICNYKLLSTATLKFFIEDVKNELPEDIYNKLKERYGDL